MWVLLARLALYSTALTVFFELRGFMTTLGQLRVNYMSMSEPGMAADFLPKSTLFNQANKRDISQ